MNGFVPNTRILYVDDEENLLAAFVSLLRREGVKVSTVNFPQAVEETLRRDGPFAMVFSDQRMPGMDGVAVLELVSRLHPETIRVLMTGFASHEDAVRAINKGGIRQYITKPWDDEALRLLVRDGVRTYNLQCENAFLLKELKEKNDAMKEMLQGTLAGTTKILGDMVSHVNGEAAAQTDRVRRAGKTVLGLIPDVNPVERWEALRAFDLFNLGIAVLPAWILIALNKNGLSSIERFPIAVQHHFQAADMLMSIPRFEGVAHTIRLQNKNYDGTGEPRESEVRGSELPLGSRILHILLDLDRQSTSTFRGRAVLEQMVRRSDRYDTSILRTLLQGKRQPEESTELSLSALGEMKPGMILVDDLMNREGNMLLRRGGVLTDGALAMIHRWAGKDGVIFPVRVRLEQ